MDTGITARLDRIGSDGRYIIVPMDHGITLGAVKGLKDIESTIDAVTRGGADAVLTQKGIAPRVHPNKNDAGYIVHLNASTVIGPDSNDKRMTGTVQEAIAAGADAVSLHHQRRQHLRTQTDHRPRGGRVTRRASSGFQSSPCPTPADRESTNTTPKASATRCDWRRNSVPTL